MPWAAAIAAVGAIGGAVVSSNAAGAAAKTQATAAKNAADQQAQGFTTAEGYLKPYAQIGDSVLPQLKTALGLDGTDPAQMLDMLKKYPGYQFAVDEGNKAVNTAQIGLGGNAMQSMSPNAAKALIQFDQNSATGLYDNYVSKLFNFGQMGQAGAGSLANAAIGKSSAIADGITGAGNATAAGQAAQGNIWGNTLTKLGQAAGTAYNDYTWGAGNNGGLQTYAQNSSGDWNQPNYGMW